MPVPGTEQGQHPDVGPVYGHRLGSHLRRRRRLRVSNTSTAASPPLKTRGSRLGERSSLKYALKRILLFLCISIGQARCVTSLLMRFSELCRRSVPSAPVQ